MLHDAEAILAHVAIATRVEEIKGHPVGGEGGWERGRVDCGRGSGTRSRRGRGGNCCSPLNFRTKNNAKVSNTKQNIQYNSDSLFIEKLAACLSLDWMDKFEKSIFKT